jgi:phosphoglycerate dehydrogenase-like enzyme
MDARVLVTLALPLAEQEFLQTQLADSEFRFRSASQVTDEDLDWATIMFGNLKPAERLIPRKNLRWLHTPNVGLEAYAELPKQRPDIKLTRSHGVNDHAVAEHALAMLLFLTRGLQLLAAAQAQQRWERAEYMARGATVLAGKTAHVLGYGGIARCLIDKLLGLGMQVCVYRREGHGDDARVQRYVPFAALPREIGGADVLFGVLPDHPATRQLVDEPVLAAMKRTAYLVNIGRGSLVNEAALARVLSAGRLAGAALDVFDTEPLRATSPLWEMANVLISPHVAGRFDAELRRHCDLFVRLAVGE